MWRRKKNRGRQMGTEPDATPQERHAEFERQNGEWHHKVEESLTELRELAGEGESNDHSHRGPEPAST